MSQTQHPEHHGRVHKTERVRVDDSDDELLDDAPPAPHEHFTLSSQNLPITEHRQALIDLIQENRCTVVIGETGSGKTTQLPQYLYEAGFHKEGPILVSQPRRVAAVSVAARVAEERGTVVGSEAVGYHVRFDRQCRDDTAIRYVTDGVLLRECLADPTLAKYSVVVLDEAHVRSLETDILFGLLKESLRQAEHRFKIVIMSATLHADKFETFFASPVYHIPGRTFPISIRHCNLINSENYTDFVERCCDVVMDIHCEQDAGDILVFLTGRGEIDRACSTIFNRAEHLDYDEHVRDTAVDGLIVVPVYGSMTGKAQQKIFEPAPPGIRKVVVATDIASTSLTVEGIVYVVDSGFVKQTMYDSKTGLDALKVVPISRSEASQRAGRAGRTREGICFRIYDAEFEQTKMHEHTVPEIQRSSLASVVLTLKCLGINDVLHFDYIDAPEEFQLLEALRRLYFFDAIDKDGQVTPFGKAMASFPLPPSHACVMLHAQRDHIPSEFLDDLAAVVAMLVSEDPFVRPGNKERLAEAEEQRKKLLEGGGDDFNTLLYIFRCCQQARDGLNWCSKFFIHKRVTRNAIKVHDQLLAILKSLKDADLQAMNDVAPPEKPPSRRRRDWWRAAPQNGLLPPVPEADREVICRLLCKGLFHNVARRAEDQAYFRTMEGNASVVILHPSSAYAHTPEKLDWAIFNQVVWTTKPFMRNVCPIKYDWVRYLLPKLRKVEVRALSSSGKVNAVALRDSQRAIAAESGQVSAEVVAAAKRRNDDTNVDAARARYLARKKAKQARP